MNLMNYDRFDEQFKFNLSKRNKFLKFFCTIYGISYDKTKYKYKYVNKFKQFFCKTTVSIYNRCQFKAHCYNLPLNLGLVKRIFS